METLLSAIDLKQLGVTGVLLGYLMWANHCLRQDLRAERDYSRERDDRFHALAQKTIETMGKLEQAFLLLRDGLK